MMQFRKANVRFLKYKRCCHENSHVCPIIACTYMFSSDALRSCYQRKSYVLHWCYCDGFNMWAIFYYDPDKL